MRRTHPLRQPLAATSPNSMGEFAPKGKAFISTYGAPELGKARDLITRVE